MHKIGHSGGYLDRLLGPLPKTLVALKTLAKTVLMPLELTAAKSATDAAIHKKMFGSGTTTLKISNEEMNDIMKIVKSLGESGLLIKGVSETIRMNQNNKKEDFLECY